MTEEAAKKLAAEKGYTVMEDAGRGWRRVVASPRPQHIVEIDQAADILRRKIVDVLNGIAPSGLEFRRVELAKELCAMLVRDVGQTFPSGDIAVVGEGWAARAHLAVGAAGDDEQPHAAPCALPDVLCHHVVDIALGVAEKDAHGGENDRSPPSRAPSRASWG